PALSFNRPNLLDALSSRDSQIGSGLCPSIVLKYACSKQAMAKGSITAALIAHANNKANTAPPADQPPGIRYIKAAAGARRTKNTRNDTPYTKAVSHAAFFSMLVAF